MFSQEHTYSSFRRIYVSQETYIPLLSKYLRFPTNMHTSRFPGTDIPLCSRYVCFLKNIHTSSSQVCIFAEEQVSRYACFPRNIPTSILEVHTYIKHACMRACAIHTHIHTYIHTYLLTHTRVHTYLTASHGGEAMDTYDIHTDLRKPSMHVMYVTPCYPLNSYSNRLTVSESPEYGSPPNCLRIIRGHAQAIHGEL